MRRLLFLACVVCVPLPIFAAVVAPRSARPVEPIDAQEAQTYAEQLTLVVNQVAAAYIRPVPRHELFLAALSGLYEEAGRPVPEGLAAELKKEIADLPAADPEVVGNLPGRAQIGVDPEGMKVAVAVRQRVGKVKGLEGMGAFRASVKALAASLDPYSGWADAAEVRRNNGLANFGFGLSVDPKRIVGGGLVVEQAAPGGPAQRAGVRPGERIVRVNRTAVKDLPLPLPLPADADGRPMKLGDVGLAQLLAPDLFQQGEEIPKLTLTIEGPGGSRVVKLEATQFEPETVFGVYRERGERWNHWADAKHQIGYIRIARLEYGTAQAVANAVQRLKQDGMRGLILDIRWGPGGWLQESVQVASLFVKEGKIATIKSRMRVDDQEYKVDGTGTFTDFPLVVLVNGETMGGSELIAASLQDNKRASIAGQRTFGKASVQTMNNVAVPEGSFKLTTGTFWRPSGKALHRFPDSRESDDWGVRPEADLEWRLTPEASRGLRDSWQRIIQRPFSAKDELELDDLENDPQLRLTLQAFVARLEKEAAAAAAR
jgi:C-terminal peptidase prc